MTMITYRYNYLKPLPWPDIFVDDMALDIDCELLVLPGDETTYEYRPDSDRAYRRARTMNRVAGPRLPDRQRPPQYFVLDRTCLGCGFVWSGDVRRQECPRSCPDCGRTNKRHEGFWVEDPVKEKT